MKQHSYTSNFKEIARFFKRIGFFLLFASIVLCCVAGINSYLINKYGDQIKPGTKTLILGDSHTENAVWPKFVKNSQNVSQPAETIFITYLKARHILENNPKIERIVVGLSYHNIAHSNDYKLIDERWSGEMFNRIYPLIGWFELISIKNIEVDIKGSLYVYIKKYLTLNTTYFENYIKEQVKCKKIKVPYIGNFFGAKKHFQGSKEWLEKRIKHQFYYENKMQISESSMFYAHKIANLAEEFNIKVYFLGTPLSQAYRDSVPKKIKYKFFGMLKDLDSKEDVRTLPWLDMIKNKKLLLNHDHVNRKGAARLSKKLNRVLNQEFKKKQNANKK